MKRCCVTVEVILTVSSSREPPQLYFARKAVTSATLLDYAVARRSQYEQLHRIHTLTCRNLLQAKEQIDACQQQDTALEIRNSLGLTTRGVCCQTSTGLAVTSKGEQPAAE